MSSRSRSPSRSRSRSRRSRSESRSPSKSPPRRASASSKRDNTGTRENAPESNVIGVFGMSMYTDERKLRDLCERYGKVEKCVVVLDRDRRPRGFAFVTFDSTDSAAEAKDKMNGKEIDGREVRVDFSVTKRAHSPTPGQYMGRDRSPRRETRRRDRSRSRSPRARYGRDRSRSRGRHDRSRSRDRYSRRERRSRSPYRSSRRERSVSPYSRNDRYR